ncbi:MAG: Ser-Thr-rich GPI-anchored membrane family protein, partial [Planctomycetia bacterium]
VNNTVYQQVGNAVSVVGSSNITLQNNILWTDAGFGISVDAGSQSGFASDSNLFWTSATGKVGQWQGGDRPTLAAWRSATLGDRGSLYHDPLFVSPAGIDGVLGYDPAANRDGGDDDDFHERSIYGSYHGGSLAPVLGAGGLPVAVTGTWVDDLLAGFPAGMTRSPVIDRGRATDAYSAEPAANGGFVNIGAYGNTAQASKSPSTYMLVTSPDGGEAFPQARAMSIRWRSESLGTGTAEIELLRDGTAEPVVVIATSTANDGEYSWIVPGSLSLGDGYRIRVSRSDDLSLSDVSDGIFSIAPPITVFYVNDATVVAGDWSLAAGDDTNDGLSPATPMASISSLLATYDFGPGDIIRVDAGTYALTRNIVLTDDDSGVVIEG